LVAQNPGSVLLQTSRFDTENYRSYLFLQPEHTLSSSDDQLFDKIESACAAGAYAAGFITYEFGQYLQKKHSALIENSHWPLAWFGIYRKAFVFDHRTGAFQGERPDDFLLPGTDDGEWYRVRSLEFAINEKVYAQKIAKIHDLIAAGETYQVNLTDSFHFDFEGSPAAMFGALSGSQSVSYSAFLRLHDSYILSFSPELFFRRRDNAILVRPMKGTAPRGQDTGEDKVISDWLRNDVKNQSENVMIVDLLRNDLGRLCEYGSVKVNQLFSVEKYETLFQMTSEICGTLRPEVHYSAIFDSLFPCGSVTGAPKLRTMDIIRAVEQKPRGVYTGAIGFFSPKQEAVFNVAIRTVILEKGRGTMGVGSGIVADSRAVDEYRECLLKSKFLECEEPPFQLLESILWQDGYHLLQLHIERMQSSAEYFDFQFSREALHVALKGVESGFRAHHKIKVRVLLERSGTITVSHSSLEERDGTCDVIFSPIRVSSRDRFLRHKTTRRRFYDQQYEWALRHGYDEVLFLNEHGHITEGAISNVFIERAGSLFTPPVSCGLLPGVYRHFLLTTRPRATESILRIEDLETADAVYVCNAVRGCRQVNAIQKSAFQSQE